MTAWPTVRSWDITWPTVCGGWRRVSGMFGGTARSPRPSMTRPPAWAAGLRQTSLRPVKK